MKFKIVFNIEVKLGLVNLLLHLTSKTTFLARSYARMRTSDTNVSNLKLVLPWLFLWGAEDIFCMSII